MKSVDIEFLKGTQPYGKTETIKLYESLKSIADEVVRVTGNTQTTIPTFDSATITLAELANIVEIIINNLETKKIL